MTAVIWPFPPGPELIEELQWATDVIRAKSAEQRISLRSAPRRTFQLSHTLHDHQYSHARSLIREAHGGDGFLVPDWGQSTYLGAVAAGSNVPVDLSDVDIDDTAILWQSADTFESVTLSTDSGGTTIDTVAGNYTSARLLPLWPAYSPDGLTASRGAARYSRLSIAMETDDNRDLSVTPAVGYRSLDVLDACPVIASGELDESIAWPVTAFDNPTGISRFMRRRSMPDMNSIMRWHLFTRAEQFALRGWLHYRRGRQKAFWMSSRGKDLEPADNITATTVIVFALPGLTGLGRTEAFDIEVKTASTSHYRRVTGLTAGTPVGGRSTINMTIDSSMSVSLAAIERISYLRCTRLDADRIELLHQAAGGMSVQVPMIEIPTP